MAGCGNLDANFTIGMCCRLVGNIPEASGVQGAPEVLGEVANATGLDDVGRRE